MSGRRALRAWYEPRRMAYPWRWADPYGVLVSEVMLQQTQAARLAGAYGAFMRRFPTVRALARAPRADVLRAWGSLGYNRRAVALSEAARAIVRDHRGRVPGRLAELRRLPGVGPYTAAAVASVGYGAAVPALDTNVRRVVARHRLGTEPSPGMGAEVERAAEAWLDRADPGAWNQALMDLGREVCRPAPRCGQCPMARGCRFRRSGVQPGPRSPTQPPFPGSFRQVRGAVVRDLRGRPSASLASLAAAAGVPLERVAAAVAALHADGVVDAGPAALAGRSSGRVRLAR
ncbi:MAG: A/G-specific adenine glycosylase [Actinomycetota bacterium]